MPLESHFHQRIEEQRKESKQMEENEEKIHEEKQSYASGLTIHGANRIATGGPASKVIWTILVVASFTTSVLISKEHWDSYLSKNSLSKIKINTPNSIEMPTITIL